MFGSAILDVAIGLIVVFSLFSLVVAAVRELIEGWFKTRAKMLEQGIAELLGEEPQSSKTDKPTAADSHASGGMLAQLYNHPLIFPLFQGAYERRPWSRGLEWIRQSHLPTYIPASTFAKAVLDLAAHGPVVMQSDGGVSSGREAPRDASETESSPVGVERPPLPVSSANHATSLAELPPATVRENLGNVNTARVLRHAIDLAGGDIDKVRDQLEDWFNDAMGALTSAYKRRTQAYLLLLGFLLAVSLNVNTVTIARYLYRDAGARAALVASAGQLSRDSVVKQSPLDTLMRRIEALELPIGWERDTTWRAIAAKGDSATRNPFSWTIIRLIWASPPLYVVGWVITAIAVSLGAPFWFDLLAKVVAVRSAVKPKDDEDDDVATSRKPVRRR